MSQKKIAIVVSRFNEAITQKLFDGCIDRLGLQEMTVSSDAITWVPGVVEIPLIAQRYAKAGYDAVICLGAVVRGETTHYDYVCQQVSYGCQRVALDHDVPVVFGVLTTENSAQAHDRLGGAHGHKGHDAADVALEMMAT